MKLLRCFKYLASLEESDPKALMRAEFVRDNRVELDISVYDVEVEAVVRVCAEHKASFSDPPKKSVPGFGCLDMSALHDCEPTVEAGESAYFDFMNRQHRVLSFLTEDDLASTLAKALTVSAARHLRASCDDVRAYIKLRIAEQSGEWTSRINDGSRGQKWRAFAGIAAESVPTQIELPTPAPTNGEQASVDCSENDMASFASTAHLSIAPTAPREVADVPTPDADLSVRPSPNDDQ